MLTPPGFTDPSWLARYQYGLGPEYEVRVKSSRMVTFGKTGRMPEIALSLLAPSPGDSIIEFGAGRGDFSDRVRRAGADVFATDAAPSQLQRMAERHPCLRRAVVEMENQQLGVASFDGVVAMHVLYHLRQPAHAITKALALLREGGRMLITTKGSDSYLDLLRWHDATMIELGLPRRYRPGFLRVTESNDSEWLPKDSLTEVRCECRSQITFESSFAASAYALSTVFVRAEVPTILIASYRQEFGRQALLDNLTTRRSEWLYLLRNCSS
jgi:SAM-dependent methyltransferase